jgi:acyl-CoA synthetase (AMP-forming)/AMP-acid ligase II
VSPLSRNPDRARKLALQFVGGDGLSYGELERASCRLANGFRAVGLAPGDHIAFLLENRPELLTFAWAAQRAGLYYTPIPTHLKAEELRYILADCDAKLVGASQQHTAILRDLQPALGDVGHWLTVDRAEPDFLTLADFMAAHASTPRGEEFEGSAMLYTSGTTGRPKGVKRRLSGAAFGSENLSPMYSRHEMNAQTVLLSPAPLYHAAPLRSVMAVHRLGGSVIAMERFDARTFLQSIESFGATHVQVVPTMLYRLLELPPPVRESYDLSSLRCVIHAAAPCPIALKQAAIDWLGPIVNEYYGGTEGVGITYITSKEWLAHQGSVGRAIIGEPHIVGDDGQDLPVGETGLIYFANAPAFEYHKAPEKMGEVSNDRGWITLGDIGRLDADGFLYLVDRRSFVINSGGVNIYPQEIEATLLSHPDVIDAAVFGIPNAEFGEEVKAVVQMNAPVRSAEASAASLIAFCRARISHLKCPRSIEFIDIMPRSETGKLLKSELKTVYARSGSQP